MLLARFRDTGARWLAALLVVGATACGAGTVPGPPEASGQEGGASAPGDDGPRRIVSLAPALTEILFALGLGDRVAGVTSFCDHPPEAKRKPKVGGYVNPSVEAILALRPDLVLVSPNAGNRDAALAAQRAGAPLVVVHAESLEETYAAIERTASACGVPERGERLAAEVRREVERIAARVRGRAPVRTLLCLQLDPIIAAGAGTLPAELLERAGGKNVVEAPGYPRLGIETVLDRAPEVILQARMDTTEPGADEKVRTWWERWPSVPAVRDDRVTVFDGAAALRPGPRVADAVRMLSELLHPETAAGSP